MDNYAVYHHLCNLLELVNQYPQGEQVSKELERLIEQFSTQNYRVAVIGEFKRGKSSLVNTMIGTEILPTDILPTTAVINRIVYDTNQKIIIFYKDGRMENSTIDSLADYATKLDADKEKFAETIREIEVHYPFVFGQKHIEFIDTPGLNDNEKMTEATIEVLDKIDTAIVVISAVMPLSETEQKLICDLIEQKDIFHLTFVVTFIDRVSDDEEEQNRVIDLIKNRIMENTYQYFYSHHSDDGLLLDKAQAILKEPKIFAVSSRLAMRGFLKGDSTLIEKSRFNHFKIQLVALLTADQDLDFLARAKRLGNDVNTNISSWQARRIQQLDDKIAENNDKITALQEHIKISNKSLTERLLELDEVLIKLGIPCDGQSVQTGIPTEQLKKVFIKNMSSMTSADFNVENIMRVLDNSIAECCHKMQNYSLNLKKRTLEEIQQLEDAVIQSKEKNGIDGTPLRNELSKWKQEIKFPVFILTREMLIENIDNIFGNIMPIIEKTINQSLKIYYKKIADYISLWRVVMFRNEVNAQDQVPHIIDKYRREVELLQKKKMEYGLEIDTDRQHLQKIVNYLKDSN